MTPPTAAEREDVIVVQSGVLTPPVAADAGAPEAAETAVFRLAEGTELLGQYQDTGYAVPKYLIRRADGQVMQLPLLLYRVAASLDGRSAGQIAAELSAELGQELTAENVSFLVTERLQPVGLLTAGNSASARDVASPSDTASPEPAEAGDRGPAADDAPADPAAPSTAPVRSDPLLALRYRVGVVPAGVVWRIAGFFRPLFARPVWIPVVALFVGLQAWTLGSGHLLDHAMAGLRQVVHQPVLILLILGMTAISGGFHECGHVTACRYGGGRPGDMGIGLFIVWPAFYSTVTDSYRLSRMGRLRTDLGGIYFNVIFMTAVSGLYHYTGQPWLLLAVISMFTETAYQFFPSLRLDGYYILADLVGVPDLFGYIGPVLTSLLPGRPTHPRVGELRPWRRRLIVLWVAVTIPALLFGLGVFLIAAPTVIPLLWPTVVEFLHTIDNAARSGDVVTTALGVLQLFFLLLPWVGSALITWSLLNMLRRLAVQRWGRGWIAPATWARVRRGLAWAGTAGLMAAVVIRVVTVAVSLPPSRGEARLVNSAIAAVKGVPSGPQLSADQWLAREQLIGYARLTGAFDRHASVLTGGRELAVLATVVLIVCLLVVAQRRRLRPRTVALALAATLLMGPAVATLATVSPGLLGAAWVAVGMLLLRRSRHLRSVRAVPVVGAAALLVGVVTEPLLVVPLTAGLLASPAGRHWAGTRRTAGMPTGTDRSWLAGWLALALAVPVGVIAVAAPGGNAEALDRPELAVLLLFSGIVVAAGIFVGALRPLVGAAASLLLLAALPWPGAAHAVPLLLAAVMLLTVRLVHLVSTQPVQQRPHPLLRAAVIVPGVVVAVVGLLFLPPSLPAVQHRELAAWLTGPTAPAGSVAVPAAFWGDLVRDGVPPGHMVPAESPGEAAWTICVGKPPAGSHLPECAAPGSKNLAVQMTPHGRAQAQAQAQEQGRAEDARWRAAEAVQADRAERQSFGDLLSRNPRITGPSQTLDSLARGNVDLRAMAALAQLSGAHTVAVGEFPASGSEPQGGLRTAVLITALDGGSAAQPDVAGTVTAALQGLPSALAPAQMTSGPSGVTAVWSPTGQDDAVK